MTTVYISGPITGKPDLNKNAFHVAQIELEGKGFQVFNPHSVPAPEHPEGLTPKALWQYYMKHCIRAMMECDELYMLADWQNSSGAVWEHRIAEMLGMPIVYQPVF